MITRQPEISIIILRYFVEAVKLSVLVVQVIEIINLLPFFHERQSFLLQMDNFLDIVGQIMWFSIPFSPLLTMPLTWKHSKAKKPYRIFIGLLFAILISVFFYVMSMTIVLRDGLGPT